MFYAHYDNAEYCNRDRDCFVNCLLGCIFTWSSSSSYVNNPVFTDRYRYLFAEIVFKFCFSANYSRRVTILLVRSVARGYDGFSINARFGS
jgi:hypothetical protein